MKIQRNPALSLFSSLIILLLISACDDTDQVVIKPEILPSRLEEADYKREMFYDDFNRLSKVKISSFFPNDVVLESNYEFAYTPDGKFQKCVSSDGYRMEYTYEGDRIVRTDEFVNDTFTQYHAFEYDERGRLTEILTWQNIPEEGGWVAPSKGVYIYDDHDNLVLQFAYYYNSGTQQYKLLSSYEYSGYDNMKESESRFDGLFFNPTLVLRKNNPGKMVIKNMYGNTSIVESFAYTYNADGFVTKKTTTTTFVYSGETGSYDTNYFYEERTPR